MADPWMKFYTSDWRADPRLRMCSPAARGLWIEMICIMHEATPYGQLRVHGQPPNEAQLASLTGIREAEIPDLIAELALNGVFSRTREGVIYSRKLVRMDAKSAKARKNGKKGGNPAISATTSTNGKQWEKQDPLNLQDNGRVKTQKPEPEPEEEKRDPIGSPKDQPLLSDLPKPDRRRKPVRPLPADWVPSDKNIADALARNFSAQEIDHEADQFRNHHTAKGNTFRDWDAAWRTWLGNARGFAHRGMAGTAHTGGRGRGSSIASIVARRHLAG